MCLKGPKDQEASALESEMARMASEDHAYWKDVFKPLENAAIDDANRAGSEAAKADARGKANVAVMDNAGVPKQINPNQASTVQGIAQKGMELGRVGGMGIVAADVSQEQDSVAKKVNLVSAGRGQTQRANAAGATAARVQASHNAMETAGANDASMATGAALGNLGGIAYGMNLDRKTQKTATATESAKGG